MSVKMNGQSKSVEAEVDSVDQMSEEAAAQVTAVLPAGEGSLGAGAAFTVNMESGVYPCVIPIEALREDSKGFYCLSAEPEKTILGEEMKAVRINVEVLEKSSTEAAVTGPVSKDIKLITVSDKSVREGDRVRVVDK